MGGDFICNVYGKQIVTETTLSQHGYAVHREVESPCTLCDKSFLSKKKVSHHIRATHVENEAS